MILGGDDQLSSAGVCSKRLQLGLIGPCRLELSAVKLCELVDYIGECSQCALCQILQSGIKDVWFVQTPGKYLDRVGFRLGPSIPGLLYVSDDILFCKRQA
jgi:hypothetical protein